MSTKTPPTRNGLTKTIRTFYGVGDMCFALMTSVGTYYSTFYLTNVAQLSLANVAIVTTTVATLDAFTSWIYGAIMNSTKPMKWGRYRSWLVAFTWLIPIFYFFQYVKVSENETIATAVFFFFHFGSRFIHNFPYIANVAMINVVAKTPEERVAMSSSRATWNNMSKFAWSYLGVPFLALLTSIFTEKYSYAVLSCLLACTMVITYWFHFKMFEGYEDTGAVEKASVAKTKRAKTKPLDLIKAILTNPPLVCLLIADLAKWLFNFGVSATAVYYFTYIALNKGLQATYILIIAFLAVIGAYASRYIGKLFSGKMIVIVCYVLMAAVLLIARMNYTNVWLVIILLSVAQLGYGVCYTCSTALYGDAAIYSEWKTNKNASGWIMGLNNVPLKAGGMLRSIILAAIFAASGFNAKIPVEQATVAMKDGIANSLLLFPALFLAVGAVVLLIGFRLNKNKLAEMQKEIEARKSAEV